MAADLAQGGLDGLLGVLSNAIKDQVKLLKGVEGDIQFIRDEMDSMNGFLLSLTKTKKQHDDSIRAWMKQVRDLTFVADDCIKLYMRDLTPRDDSMSSIEFIRYYVRRLLTVWTRLKVANQLHELKERVRQVGERRQRYDVKVPRDDDSEWSTPLRKDGQAEEKRADFLRALDESRWEEAIKMLPYSLAANNDDKSTAVYYAIYFTIREKVNNDALMKMLLRALYAYPYGTEKEVEGLVESLKTKGADVEKLVMNFCYSKLRAHYKGSLQYLTTFQEEDSISRKSVVRRWLAEGLVVVRDEQEQGRQPDESLQEAGLQCFDELVFRGFLRRPGQASASATNTSPKVCELDESAKKFIPDICKSDNFVAHLPTHFSHQLEIRKIARQCQNKEPPAQQPQPRWWPWSICPGPTKPHDAHNGDKLPHDPNPMDEMIEKVLKKLPQEYRLNVIDLGGCQRLEKRHLQSICKVYSLKYLSLRNTNISQLPKQMSELWQLETLDIRQTLVSANGIRKIFLHSLKHLLAGNITNCKGKEKNDPSAAASTVLLPRKLGSNIETLCYVQIDQGGRAAAASNEHNKLAKLIGPLKRLRKLGVVLCNSSEDMNRLVEAVNKRRESLSSLSIWIKDWPGVTNSNNDDDDIISKFRDKLPEMLTVLKINGVKHTSVSDEPILEN
ncbi:hypothetical protein ABZP36_009478 [Zizania latifolia]